ncbi:MAG: stage 0 sporulation family protein [Clostridia bacterium]|nr:stage 0 sporulation family protein [Clostridia bacterium]
MIEIMGIRFRNAGKIYYFAPNGITAEPGQKVIVQTVRGIEIGTVVLGNKEIDESENVKDLSPVLRLATEEDQKKDEENRKKEEEAFSICEEKIKKHGLDMKLINVEYTFDCSKIVFCFVADGRVDFRELVKDLAGIFKTRIELRQIGVRDQTKTIAGLGLCGRKVCCSAFLTDFDQITVKMAKDQGLSSSPQKISGPCGKLICCLSFEQKAYEADYKELPRLGSYVKTPNGCGTVCEVFALKQGVRVRLEDKPDETPAFYKKEDLTDPNAPEQPQPKKEEIPAPVSIEPPQEKPTEDTANNPRPKHKKKPFYKKHKPNKNSGNGPQ